MANHPNRGAARSPSPSPTPAEVRAEREVAGLTQTQAAHVVHVTLSSWQKWEGGQRPMHPGLWELFRIKAVALR